MLQRFVAESLPTDALLHSYLTDIRWTAEVGKDPHIEALSDNANHELHHLAALWGALLRLDMGDPTAWSSVGLNAARLLYRRRMTGQLAEELPEALRQNPQVRAVLSLIDQGRRELDVYRPALVETISSTGWQRAMEEG